MLRAASMLATVAAVATLAACGSPAPSPTPTAGSETPGTSTPSGSTSASASPTTTGTPTQADLVAVEKLLYPSSPSGAGDCLSGGGGPPSVLGCPVTRRLAQALSAALNDPNAAADPLCGCQAIDPHQTVTYTPGTPPNGGTIHVTGFGTPQVAYVVIRSTGQLLVDDVVYCTPSPHSIYTGETVTSC